MQVGQLSDAMLRRVFNLIDIPLLMLDTAGEIVIWNDAHTELVGVGPAAVREREKIGTYFYDDRELLLAERIIRHPETAHEVYDTVGVADDEYALLQPERGHVYEDISSLDSGREPDLWFIAVPVYVDDTFVGALEILQKRTASSRHQQEIKQLISKLNDALESLQAGEATVGTEFNIPEEILTEAEINTVERVSDIAAMRDELQEQHRRRHALFRNSQDAIVEFVCRDETAIIENANDRFLEFFAGNEDTVSGKPLVDIVGDAESQLLESTLGQALRGGESFDAEVERQTTTGDRTFRLRTAPIEVDTEVRGYASYTDITEQKQRQQYLELLDRVLRHNLRNDLQLIRGLAADACNSETQVNMAHEKIVARSDKLAKTASKVRQIADIAHGSLDDRTISLGSFLQHIAEDVRSAHPDVTINVACPTEIELTTVERFDAAVEELLRNAVEHNTAESPEVTVSASEGEDSVTIEVADNGPRIEEIERDVLRANAETTPLYHGSGLGLALIQLVVARAGGDVTVEDRTPTGNVMTLRVPK